MFVNQNQRILRSALVMSAFLLGTLASSPAAAQRDLSILGGAAIPSSRGDFSDKVNSNFSVSANVGFAPKSSDHWDLVWSMTHAVLEGSDEIENITFSFSEHYTLGIWDISIVARPYVRARNSNLPIYLLVGLGGSTVLVTGSTTTKYSGTSESNYSSTTGYTRGGFLGQAGAGFRIPIAKSSNMDIQGRYLLAVCDWATAASGLNVRGDNLDRIVIEAGISHTWGD